MATYSSPSAQGIGESEVYLRFLDQVSQSAVIDRPILIIGERGTGKELAARRVHYMSKRWDGPLVTMNCASLPPSLIESELFGYEKGAFTGATTSRKGRFEEAEGGTLFLDEIGLIPLSVQEKLLRVVEYGTFERVGSSETRHVDVRIVGATNADLKKMSEEGKFKEDLLDRLSFEVLFVPPLRMRGDDILLLASHFAARMAVECEKETYPVFSYEVQKKMLSYPWPGNVRELKNTVERAVYKAEGEVIEDISFDPFLNPYIEEKKVEEKKEESPFSSYALSELEKAHEDLDIEFLKRALALSGNQRKAAEEMGISYDQFRGLYRKYKERLENS
ncbi:MAG: sigma 54-interacting transcriptional regulator [Spirochaetales bacterium]|nr:sigma 54-interacting transcriptional regulator [Candidatus Physcosoma equi]